MEYYWPFLGGASFVCHCVVCMSCVCFAFAPVRCYLVVTCWGRWGLASWLFFVLFNCDFVSFPCGLLDRVWYLIVLISDLCRLSYFEIGATYHHILTAAIG